MAYLLYFRYEYIGIRILKSAFNSHIGKCAQNNKIDDKNCLNNTLDSYTDSYYVQRCLPLEL